MSDQKPAEYSGQIHIYASPDFVQRVKKQAARQGMKVSEWMRQVVYRELERAA